MWPVLPGQNNTVQSQAVVILGCVLYVGGTKPGFLNQTRYGILLKSTGTQGLGIWRALVTTSTKNSTTVKI
jgi:hypothetical protein